MQSLSTVVCAPGPNKDGTLTLALKGTKTVSNVLTDLWANWAIDRHTDTRVHNGILKHWRSMRKDVLTHMHRIAKQRGCKLQDLPIQITGHSLGGGLANIAALDLLQRKHMNIKGVTTFAAPKVFDATSADTYNRQLGDKTLSVSQTNDPITYIGGVCPTVAASAAALSTITPAAPALTASLGLLAANNGSTVGYTLNVPNPQKGVHRLSSYKAGLTSPEMQQTAPSIPTPWQTRWNKWTSSPSRFMHTLHKGVKPFTDSIRYGLGSAFSRLTGWRSQT